jgi:hypothetical protein
LPVNLKYIELGCLFSHPVDLLPDSIQVLVFDRVYSQQINKLPRNLTHITMNDNFNYNNSLPDNITSIYNIKDFGKYNLDKIKKIKISYGEIKNIEKLQDTNIKNVIFKDSYRNLKKLKMILNNLPKNTENFTVLYDNEFNKNIEVGKFPKTLNYLKICNKEYKNSKIKNIIKNNKFYNFTV